MGEMRQFQLWVILASNLRYWGNHLLTPKKRRSLWIKSWNMQKWKDQRSTLFMLKITRLLHLGPIQTKRMARISSLWSILWEEERQPRIKASHIQGYRRELKQEFRNFPGLSRHLKWVWNLKAEVKLIVFSISHRLTKTQGSRTNLEERAWIKTAVVTWEMRHLAVSPMNQTPQLLRALLLILSIAWTLGRWIQTVRSTFHRSQKIRKRVEICARSTPFSIRGSTSFSSCSSAFYILLCASFWLCSITRIISKSLPAISRL